MLQLINHARRGILSPILDNLARGEIGVFTAQNILSSLRVSLMESDQVRKRF